jgi:hypothetical protein
MEFANPTGLLDEVMKSSLIPLREETLSVMRELLGAGATEQQVVFCETCLIGMCFQPMLIRRLRQRTDGAVAPFLINDLEAFTRHVTMFALAGIAAIRDGARSGRADAGAMRAGGSPEA